MPVARTMLRSKSMKISANDSEPLAGATWIFSMKSDIATRLIQVIGARR
jgi:hypothetical protein